MLGLLLGLGGVCLLCTFWLQPKLHGLHGLRYGLNTRPAQREAAARAFGTWRQVRSGFHVLSVAGLAVYLWRVANPPDPTRFLSASKFRS